MQTVEPAALDEFFYFRENLYQFLQFLFFEPLKKETVMKLLKDQQGLDGLQSLGNGGRCLYQFFTNVTDEKLKEEKDEFHRLFFGPEMILAPPWESVYRSKEKLLFDQTTEDVRRFYHEFDLEFIRENHEPDDHLVIELEFILHLNSLCLKETERYRVASLLDKQIEFFDLHLNKWVGPFSEKILKNTDSLLYKGAALMLKDFIKFDFESMVEIKEALLNV
jgi:TorA maturation chaperone TorD